MRTEYLLFDSPCDSNYSAKVVIHKVGTEFYGAYVLGLGSGRSSISRFSYPMADFHSSEKKAKRYAINEIKKTLKWRAEDEDTLKPQGLKELCEYFGISCVDPYWITGTDRQLIPRPVIKPKGMTKVPDESQLQLF